MLPWEVPANGPGETTAAMGVRGCGQERGTHILDVIEAQWWTPSRVLQGLCRKGLIVAMDEAAEGRKVARRLWDRDMPEKGGERGQGPREEPASPRADAHPLGWHRTPLTLMGASPCLSPVTKQGTRQGHGLIPQPLVLPPHP